MLRWLLVVFFALQSALCGATALPWEQSAVTVQLIAKEDPVQSNQPFDVGLLIKHAKGWHTYWKATGDTGLPTEVTWTLPEGWQASPIVWPTPKVFRIGDLINYGYDGQVLLPVKITPSPSAQPGQSFTLKAEVSWLMCEQQCVPGSASLSLPVTLATQAQPTPQTPLFNQPLPTPTLVKQALIDPTSHNIELTFPNLKKADGLYLFAEGQETIIYSAPQTARQTSEGLTITIQAVETVKAGDTFAGLITSDQWSHEFQTTLQSGSFVVTQTSSLIAIAMAFIGGLILNLMPCVFPVLTLKVLSLATVKETSERIRSSLSFSAGVLCTMLTLAIVLLIARSAGQTIGWGFQLQEAWFVALLTLLFTAITANLAGLFEFTPTLRTTNRSSDFATGVLTVFVASPCTAPFMGAALGYALSAPAADAIAVFLFLGLGMATPWIVLSASPWLTKWLPKPGAWMRTFRLVMAVPMVATTLWLLWVLSQQTSDLDFYLFTLAAISLYVGLYFYGKSQFGSAKFRTPSKILLIVAAISFAVACALPSPQETHNGWSPQKVQAALKEGRTVFVDFTAAWCITCQANKLAVLDTAEVQDAFKQHNTLFLEADWTRKDPAITEAIESFGRSGVPLYVVYKPDGAVIVLPQLLTKSDVTDAIKP